MEGNKSPHKKKIIILFIAIATISCVFIIIIY